ncbi:MAG: hypothetical protein HZB30_08775, partial [Nitrospirae bacterium]|nr:hypothetical protein [Nitrospirota bacterium]
VALDGLPVPVIPFLMVVSPFVKLLIDSQLERIHRLLSIYTLFDFTPLPFEFELAITEAAQGTPVSIARRALMYCMSYDTRGKKYVFNTLRVVATLMIITLVSFFIYLVVTGRKYRREIK